MKPSFYHSIAITGFFGLFALLMLWPTVLTESRFPVAMILLLSVTPLLLPMRGLLHGRRKSCAWAAYISLIYIIHGTAEAYVNPAERSLALLEILFSLMLFMGATFYVRALKS
ncbi:DUF2069 domain-containing protein [Methylicorpusculum sp.]|uniref:DUF2069 domain-containing protein n=2 Tax=Methylicorpusculum sp. TaxID=2713644 RepID=UPI002727FC6C|nr:DUF2069 domain-containing protein [Methylicorpusculum sp.]MDO8844467.1 DUF2069 domain-containing protein [Methylicorpusculum sp.]MDP2179076.1 DUF2069 domain-containing protein [Methylicorpusculum sp.]MDP3529446.1 DUF2069 domain-containing protein [Methylicorpusculum sp.]